jgi:hypothetical protein
MITTTPPTTPPIMAQSYEFGTECEEVSFSVTVLSYDPLSID